jgi:hypothetical protein
MNAHCTIPISSFITVVFQLKSRLVALKSKSLGHLDLLLKGAMQIGFLYRASVKHSSSPFLTPTLSHPLFAPRPSLRASTTLSHHSSNSNWDSHSASNSNTISSRPGKHLWMLYTQSPPFSSWRLNIRILRTCWACGAQANRTRSLTLVNANLTYW